MRSNTHKQHYTPWFIQMRQQTVAAFSLFPSSAIHVLLSLGVISIVLISTVS